jgi:hypothetical protein
MRWLSSPRIVASLLASAGAVALVAALAAVPSPLVRTARADDGAVPSSGAELFPYLQSGAYKAFAHESKVHRSQGPHGDVVTYVNPILEASLKAKNEAHPPGAAAVKELHDRNNTLIGWSVSVKTQGESDEGNGWYWYEVYSTTDGSGPLADEKGAALCTGCHSSGRDFVRIQYPLR